MPDRIMRQSAVKPATIASGGNAVAVDVRGFAGGIVIMPATINGTNLAWSVSHDNSTFVALYDEDGALEAGLANIAASRAYAIPSAAFGAPYIKATMDTQGQATTLQFCMNG